MAVFWRDNVVFERPTGADGLKYAWPRLLSRRELRRRKRAADKELLAAERKAMQGWSRLDRCEWKGPGGYVVRTSMGWRGIVIGQDGESAPFPRLVEAVAWVNKEAAG
jgi:hypothetical protein